MTDLDVEIRPQQSPSYVSAASEVTVVRRHDRGALGAALFVVFMLLVLSVPSVRRQLQSINLLPKNAHYTELYVAGVNSLPLTVVDNQLSTVSFTIASHESTLTKYSWVASLVSDGQSGELAQGSAQVSPRGQTTIPVEFKLGPNVRDASVHIELLNRSEQIMLNVVGQPR